MRTGNQARPVTRATDAKCGHCASGCAASPARIRHDPGYRRLRYCRYADDNLLGFTGPKAEAEEIKQRLAAFLRDELKLELSPDKTLITHARTERGAVPRLRDSSGSTAGRARQCQRPAEPPIAQRDRSACTCPVSVIKAKSAPYMRGANPRAGTPTGQRGDYSIVATYGAKYRGIVQYYLLAGDVYRLHRLRWVMETSMLKTLAGKHRSSVSKMAAAIQGQDRDTARATHVLRGQRRASRQEATGRTVRRDSTQAAEDGGRHRPPRDRAVYPTRSW